MNIAVMQPTYLPWAGYFNLISQAGRFVFLDDVQFSHQSWQQRNRIILNGNPYTLTVPVITGRARQSICEVAIDESRHWRRKHLGTLRQAYARHPHGPAVLALLEPVLLGEQKMLAELNIDLILALCRALNIRQEFHRGTQLHITGSRSGRLVEICHHFAADTYLSVGGSREYIEQDGVFAASDVRVVFHQFEPLPYPQRGTGQFVSHMSVVDLLANIGFEEGRKYVLCHHNAEPRGD